MNSSDSLIAAQVESAPVGLPALSNSDLRDICLRQENTRALEALREIILIEEDNVLSVDEVLGRVLDFYARFVPFKEYMGHR